MKRLSWAAALLSALGLMAGATSGARADTMFTLGPPPGGSLPAGNYGSVAVTSVNANELEIVVTLSGTNHFANTGIAASFAFNLNGFGTITVTGLPTAPVPPQTGQPTWSAENTTAGSINMAGAGTFQYGLTFVYPNNPNPPGNTDGNSLDFFITAAGIGSSITNVTGVAADICTTAPNANNNCTGLTGPVVGSPVAVPAPFVGAGLPGLIAACFGLVAFARRRRSRIA